MEGLSFAVPPKQLIYSDYLINFELFYRSTNNLKILSGNNLDLVKTRIKDTSLTSFRDYNANVPQHPSNREFEALKTLSKTVIWSYRKQIKTIRLLQLRKMFI